MLTIGESKIIFFYISLFSTLAIIPFKLDPHNGRLLRPSKFLRIVWCFFFSLSVLHSIYDVIQFMILLANGIHSVPLHTSVIHLGMLYVGGAFLMAIFLAAGRQPGLLVLIFNELYSSSEF